MNADFVFPFNRDYGLPDSVRAKIVADADAVGVARAAKDNNVHMSSVYRWRSALGTKRAEIEGAKK